MWLEVAKSANGGTSLRWGNSVGPYPKSYEVGAASVVHATRKVRDALVALTSWSINSDEERLPPVLLAVASAGYELRECLFTSIKDQDVATQVMEWVKEQVAAGDSTLRITSDSSIHIPWGLVYDEDPESAPPASAEPRGYDAFWCLKYSLSTTLGGYTHSKTKLTRHAQRARLLSLVNREVLGGIQAGPSFDLKDKFEELIKQKIGAAFDLRSCKKIVERSGAGDTIFHFFGHQHDSQLDLGVDGKISLREFRNLIDQITLTGGGPSSSFGLVFVNGCDGAWGDADYSLFAVAHQPGMCGLVSTESLVPFDFAAKFSVRFLDALLRGGKSIGEAMDSLRRDAKLWPLSLLYGCYAQPDFRISAPAAL